MDFPNKINIHIVDSEEAKPVANIAITLTIFANNKNDYVMMPDLSDASGTISIHKHWVECQIQEARNTFIMDYSSTLEGCKPMLGITVLSGEDIHKVGESYRTWGIHKLLEKATNHLYKGGYKDINIAQDSESVEVIIDRIQE